MRKDADVLDALLSQYRSDPTARAALSKRVEDQRHAAASARAAREAPRHENRDSLLARLHTAPGCEITLKRANLVIPVPHLPRWAKLAFISPRILLCATALR